MNEETINAIAAQLGIAADRIGEFLPLAAQQWALMRISQGIVGLAVAALFAVACAVGMRAALKRAKTLKTPHDWRARQTCIYVAVAAGVALGFLAIFIGVIGANVLGYALAPEASMARDMLAGVS